MRRKKKISSHFPNKHSRNGWEISIGLRTGLRLEGAEFVFKTNQLNRQLELRSYAQEGLIDSQLGPIQPQVLSEIRADVAAQKSQFVESLTKIGKPQPTSSKFFQILFIFTTKSYHITLVLWLPLNKYFMVFYH